MIGAAGVGKTAFFLYPNLEYACACGMSFLALDTKDDLAARAKAEKYAKILSKTIINPDGDSGSYGQNAFFYDSAEGLLTAVILLLAEFLLPKKIDGALQERRHIVSVFKLVQDLLEPSEVKGKSRFQVLMSRLPSEHKARWFAGAALNTSEQAMASVLSTVLSLFSAGRSRKLTMLPIIQSLAQLEKTMAKMARKSFRITARRPSSAVSPPTARPQMCCPRRWVAIRYNPAPSAGARGKAANPSRWRSVPS